MPRQTRSLVKAISDHPDDAASRLRVLRLIVAQRLDATTSARETGSLARVVLEIEAALRSLDTTPEAATRVDEILAARVARGAK